MGRRVAITETTGGTATTTGYLWCGNQLCAAYAAGAITARYQADGETRYAGATATPYYYERDHLGTVTSMTSATGTTRGTLTTDAYGLTLSQSGTAPTFGYAGMFVHQPTSSIPPIYLTMFRAYDPYSGRWLSRDPAGEIGGINLYGYLDESPVDNVDPQGRGVIGAITGGILGGAEGYYTGGASGAITGAAEGAVGGLITGGPLAQGLANGAIDGIGEALELASEGCSLTSPNSLAQILGATGGGFIGGALTGGALEGSQGYAPAAGAVSAAASGISDLLSNFFGNEVP